MSRAAASRQMAMAVGLVASTSPRPGSGGAVCTRQAPEIVAR